MVIVSKFQGLLTHRKHMKYFDISKVSSRYRVTEMRDHTNHSKKLKCTCKFVRVENQIQNPKALLR